MKQLTFFIRFDVDVDPIRLIFSQNKQKTSICINTKHKVSLWREICAAKSFGCQIKTDSYLLFLFILFDEKLHLTALWIRVTKPAQLSTWHTSYQHRLHTHVCIVSLVLQHWYVTKTRLPVLVWTSKLCPSKPSKNWNFDYKSFLILVTD